MAEVVEIQGNSLYVAGKGRCMKCEV
uniref:Uncharacterized protein n=1 Tax=Trichuris muris TaxID=70415 RepID=A0A5S6R001_TRIMR